MELLLKIIGFVLFIEGFTELLVNSESIVYKKVIGPFCKENRYEFLTGLFSCGWCLSLWVTAIFAAIWFFTPIIYPMSLISFWRLSNTFHTINQLLIRKKIFTGGKVQ